MAADDLAQRPLKRRHVERPGEAHSRRHVVDDAARLELIYEPEPLLCERERQFPVARRPADRRGLRPRDRALPRLYARGKPGQR